MTKNDNSMQAWIPTVYEQKPFTLEDFNNAILEIWARDNCSVCRRNKVLECEYFGQFLLSDTPPELPKFEKCPGH